uniref:Bifunctional inhibitor/plant lipid transfer protein/seed storage helical domain-containing protein n=1 Tax=Setaria viridis TaxID=4556 RepID=A0A4U6TCS3_SETVI|nr:hypothetical protein SEVIR_8G074201v2 [Setaria viridis]
MATGSYRACMITLSLLILSTSCPPRRNVGSLIGSKAADPTCCSKAAHPVKLRSAVMTLVITAGCITGGDEHRKKKEKEKIPAAVPAVTATSRPAAASSLSPLAPHPAAAPAVAATSQISQPMELTLGRHYPSGAAAADPLGALPLGAAAAAPQVRRRGSPSRIPARHYSAEALCRRSTPAATWGAPLPWILPRRCTSPLRTPLCLHNSLLCYCRRAVSRGGRGSHRGWRGSWLGRERKGLGRERRGDRRGERERRGPGRERGGSRAAVNG